MADRVPQADITVQREAAARLRARFEGGTYHIVTYGCQMNAHESETYAGIFEEMGMTPSSTRWDADIVLFNTCCVRDNAEKRLFGNIGKLCKHKAEQKPDMMIGISGCVTQQEGAAEKLLRRYPLVGFTLGAQGGHRLPEAIEGALAHRVNAVCRDERVAEGQPVRRADPFRAFVNIMYGCDNYCSYCVVPLVRGAERSRDADEIIREAQSLARDGVREITLLGQNVNSFSGGMSFARLLRELDGVVPRIRFMTSHPKDLSEEVIAAMAQSRSVARHLHLPVQSGSDRVLDAMNRRYTRARYLNILSVARCAMPDLGVSTDLIAGFPGESEDDFAQTLDLMRQAKFDAAFTFAYSPRAGTKAAAMEGQIDPQVKSERLARVIALQEEIQQNIYESLIDTRHDMLIEGPSRRGGGVSGRIGRGIMVNVQGEGDAGEIRPVRIERAKQKTLTARWEDAI